VLDGNTARVTGPKARFLGRLFTDARLKVAECNVQYPLAKKDVEKAMQVQSWESFLVALAELQDEDSVACFGQVLRDYPWAKHVLPRAFLQLVATATSMNVLLPVLRHGTVQGPLALQAVLLAGMCGQPDVFALQVFNHFARQLQETVPVAQLCDAVLQALLDPLLSVQELVLVELVQLILDMDMAMDELHQGRRLLQSQNHAIVRAACTRGYHKVGRMLYDYNVSSAAVSDSDTAASMPLRTLGTLFGPLCKTYDDFATLRLVATSSGRMPRCKGFTLSQQLLSILGASELRAGILAALRTQPHLAEMPSADFKKFLSKQDPKAMDYKAF
jgi:hypothetical protein